MKYTPKEITEEVNVTKVHPLVNFAYLLGTVIGFTLIVYFGLGIAANILVPRISNKTEKQIGDLLAPLVTAQLRAKEIEDDKRIGYIEDLVESLGGEEINGDIPLTIHLIDSKVQNAAGERLYC